MANDISLPEIQEFFGAFWFHYDSGHYDELAARLSEDVQYASRSDTGTAPFEDYLRATVHGREETMAWLTEHRDMSPYPLRHNITNTFRTGIDEEVTQCRSYLFVTTMTNFMPVTASTGIVDAGVKRAPGGLVFTKLEVILDTQDSVPFNTRAASQTGATPS